jgi:hypothetical protein
MNFKNQLILIVILSTMIYPFKFVNADSLNIYLYFDGNNIRVDNQVKNPIVYIKSDGVDRYKSESLDSKYRLEIISDNIVTYSQIINPPQTPSPFQVSIPTINIADKIRIISDNSIISDLDISQYKTCFSNLICEYEKGENIDSCPSDCNNDNVKFSEETQKTLQKENGIIRNESGTVLLSTNTPTPDTNTTAEPAKSKTSGNIAILIGGILFLAGGLGLFIWKLRKR